MASAAACLALVLLKIRSLSTYELFGWSNISDATGRYEMRHLILHSNNACIAIEYRYEIGDNVERAEIVRNRVQRYNRGEPPRRLWYVAFSPTTPPFRGGGEMLGVVWWKLHYAPPQATTEFGSRLVAVPHSYAIIVSAILPLLWLLQVMRNRRLKMPGCCTHCGYDLRASKDRCPECGTTIPSNGEPIASPNNEAP